MEIQQWIGLIGVIGYWAFRAFTASKKASKNTAPPVPKPQKEVSKQDVSSFPTSPTALPKGLLDVPEWEWKYEEEPVETAVFNYEEEEGQVGVRPNLKLAPQQEEDVVPRLKFKGFNGRDAVIYQAILNRPQW